MPPEAADRLRTAVIGVGHFGRHHAQKYAGLPGSDLIAVVDLDLGRAREVARACGTVALADHRDLFGRVDAVSVVVPTAAHCAVVSDCLAHGLHVLVEKPIAETVEQATAMIGLAAARSLVLQVGHLQRYFLDRLQIGPLLTDPLYLESYRIAPYQSRGSDVSVILDLMIHDIDLILAMVKSELTTIDAVGAPVVSAENDICNTRLKFANGCIANITASRVSLKTERKMRVFQKDTYVSIDLHDRKVVTMRKLAQGRSLIPGLPPFERHEKSYGEGDDLATEIADFLNAIRERRPPLVTGDDGRRALAAAIEIDRSLRANLAQVAGRL